MRAWRGRHQTYDGRRKSAPGDNASTKKVARQGRGDEQGGRGRGGVGGRGGGGEEGIGREGEAGRVLASSETGGRGIRQT